MSSKSLSLSAIGKMLGLAALAGLVAIAAPHAAHAQNLQQGPNVMRGADNDQPVGSYSQEEIIAAGHNFFGGLSQDLAGVIEQAFRDQGRPNGYILGEEGGGAFIAGVRYGEGVLHTRNDGNHRVFWQGPSIGLDYGASGSRTMILVYNLPNAQAIYRTFGAIEGSAYIVGGAGLTYLRSDPIIAAPVRTGVGLRLGISAGYIRFTQRPTWNPF